MAPLGGIAHKAIRRGCVSQRQPAIGPLASSGMGGPFVVSGFILDLRPLARLKRGFKHRVHLRQIGSPHRAAFEAGVFRDIVEAAQSTGGAFARRFHLNDPI
jgi:hypothetical protein